MQGLKDCKSRIIMEKLDKELNKSKISEQVKKISIYLILDYNYIHFIFFLFTKIVNYFKTILYYINIC